MTNTLNQFYVFLGAVYGGIIIGIWYDVLRLVRIMTVPRPFWCAVCDLVFWIGAAVLFFMVMLDVDNGDLRVYTLLGAAVGFALYIIAPSRLIMKGFSPLARGGGEYLRRVRENARVKRAQRKAEREAMREAARREAMEVEQHDRPVEKKDE